MTLNITNTQTPIEQIDLSQSNSAATPTNANPIIAQLTQTQRDGLTVRAGHEGSWDFGLSVSQLLREGSIGAALRLLGIPSQAVAGAEDVLKSWLGRIVTPLLNISGVRDIDQLLKFEINVPFFDPRAMDAKGWKNFWEGTTIHFKFAPSAWTGLSAEQRAGAMSLVTQLPINMVTNLASGIVPPGNTVGDFRVSVNPFTFAGGIGGIPTPQLQASPELMDFRAGAMFIVSPRDLFATRPINTNFLDLPVLGFFSPRVRLDGSIQIVFGAAADISVNQGVVRIPGNPFFEVAYAGSVRIKPGQLVKTSDGGYGFVTRINGVESVVSLPASFTDKLPDALKQQSVLINNSQYTIIAMADYVAPFIESSVKREDVQKAKDLAAAVRPILEVVTNPASRDAATLLSGLLGFRGGPITGVISTLLALGQVSENRFNDFYAQFSAMKPKDAQAAVQLLNTSIDLVIEERARRLQYDAEQVRLGLRNSAEVTINSEARGAIDKLVEIYDRAIGKSIESGASSFSVVQYYKELSKLSIGSDPFKGEIAKNILGIRGNGPAFLYFSADQGGGRVRLNDNYRSHASEAFRLINRIINGTPEGISVQEFRNLDNNEQRQALGIFFVTQGGDALSLYLKAATNGIRDKSSRGEWMSIVQSWAFHPVEIILKNMIGQNETRDETGDIATWSFNYNIKRNGQTVLRTLENIKEDFGIRNLGSLAAGIEKLRDQKVADFGSPEVFLRRMSLAAMELLRNGYDTSFGNADLADRIQELKNYISGDGTRPTSVFWGFISDEKLRKLRVQYPNGWIPTNSSVILNILYNRNGSDLRLSLNNDTLYAGPIDQVDSGDGMLNAISLRNRFDIAVETQIAGIYERSDLTLEQKNQAVRLLLQAEGLSPEFIADKLTELETRIGVRLTEKGNLTNLKTQSTEALRIARESGNQLGALLATLVNGVLDTLLAKVDDSTKELAFSGGVNAIAAAATAAGLTFSEFVQLIGRGDLAAFGAVIGDIGEVYRQANLGNSASTIGAGFELVGNALNAIGRQKNDRGLILAGTAVNGVGSVLKASQGPVGAATTAGFKLAGNLATVLGQLGNSNELQALGLTLNAVVDIPRLFTNFDPATGAGRTDGSAALATAASQIAGLLLGGDAGRVVAGIGSLVSTGFQIAGNTVPGGEGSLYVTAARQLLNILGVKLDPAVNFALGTLSTALAGGPVGWAVWAVGLLFNFAQMGSFSKTSVLAENIDADGDGKTDDMASLRQDFRRGFFGNVRQTGHNILYDVNGVDVRLLQNSQLSLTPEVRTIPIAVTSSRNYSFYAVTINGHRVTGRLVDAQGRPAWTNQIASGGVFMQIGDIARMFTPGAGDPSLLALSNQRFAVKVDNFGKTVIVQETGNFVLKIDATYAAINPSTTAINASKTWVLDPAATAVWRNFMGGDTATIAGTDPRAAAGNYLANALDQMTAQYRGQQNDPNLYMYMDMNGDGNPDRVRVGLQIDGLREKGDGKIEVWLLDANRKDTSVSYIANNFGEAEEIGAMSNQLMNWGAGRPDVWAIGKDIGSFYIHARNTGALALMREANMLTATTLTALLSGNGANMEAAFARLDQINQALASPFNANDYMTANPGVATYAGGDPVMAAHHYIQWGNAAGFAVNTAGLVLAKPVSRNTLENAALLTNQTIVSDNGQYFAVFQTDGNLAVYRGSLAVASGAIWSSMTGWQAEGGSVTMQADGNLVVRDAAGNAKWSSGTDGGIGVNRSFKLVIQDDGNLVIYDTQGGGALWSTKGGRIAKPAANAVAAVVQQVVQQSPIAALIAETAQQSPLVRSNQTWLAGYTNIGNSMANNQNALRTGQFMASANGKFVTVMQTDGNLVNYELNTDGTMKRVVWQSQTSGVAAGGTAYIQNDGNLAIWNAAGTTAHWNSDSWGQGVARTFNVVLQDDGNLVIYDYQGGEALWSNYTGRIARPEANAA